MRIAPVDLRRAPLVSSDVEPHSTGENVFLFFFTLYIKTLQIHNIYNLRIYEEVYI